MSADITINAAPGNESGHSGLDVNDPFGLTAAGAALDDPNANEGEGEEFDPPSQEQWDAQQAEMASLRTNSDADRTALRNFLTSAPQDRGQAPGVSPLSSPPVPTSPAAPSIDFSNQPDPVTDPEGHTKWMRETFQSVSEGFNASLQTAVQGIEDRSRQSREKDATTARYDRFIAKYPGLEGKTSYIDAASQSAGLLPGDSEAVMFEKTAKRLEADGMDLGAPREKPPAPNTGVGGGSGGTRPRRKGGKPEPKPVDLVDAVSKSQVELGIY